jgi:hypothetical protein
MTFVWIQLFVFIFLALFCLPFALECSEANSRQNALACLPATSNLGLLTAGDRTVGKA